MGKKPLTVEQFTRYMALSGTNADGADQAVQYFSKARLQSLAAEDPKLAEMCLEAKRLLGQINKRLRKEAVAIKAENRRLEEEQARRRSQRMRSAIL